MQVKEVRVVWLFDSPIQSFQSKYWKTSELSVYFCRAVGGISEMSLPTPLSTLPDKKNIWRRYDDDNIYLLSKLHCPIRSQTVLLMEHPGTRNLFNSSGVCCSLNV